ncbi:predicted protein [Pyrenophora tritici-repentis Pt-1C-BFP]|uniref:Uncharacterized protein n=1 Tax=Pyrenophora tritici-repentis (strain Pt-1C-BFP) TaxID=426418 RepID=B2VY10_PYRTR|nr:uncharacterized protein PTRG_03398 [Pyrenophora tritici-repentis Pt-1C-BFP]EDU45921.1 predicted protein [Pyrenophora tritici-repentis Pt-1C-BFP]
MASFQVPFSTNSSFSELPPISHCHRFWVRYESGQVHAMCPAVSCDDTSNTGSLAIA